jgi:DNA polymerase-1
VLADARTGRLHTTYQQLVAATGRLSSTEPNLQNIPIRTEMGAKIRRAFIAPPGHVLIAADYSQIELRVLAHLSGDPLLCQSFAAGEDVHTRTALEMFGPVEGQAPDKRRAAKMINYGIVYGLSDFGLAARLGIERKLAKQYIEEYFVRYKGVKDFMDELVLRARRDGGARTLLGRFRPLPDLTSRNYQMRAYAERIAKNTPIQGTAADILKQAMIDVQAQLSAREPATRMLLTVHDELVLEAPQDRQEPVCALVQTAMERAVELKVPLKVDVGAAQSWADC